MTKLANSVALVTGGSRGLGKALVEELYARGAGKVYATARDPRTITHPDAVPLALEVTDPASVAAVAERAQDVTVLINNAGAATGARLLDAPLDAIRTEFEINYYGPLLLTRAFAPVIERNGGGHILNVHSVLSWLSDGSGYSSTKAAMWSQTNGLRLELRPRGIDVTGLHMGYVDTDMTAGIEAPKANAHDIAVAALDGVEAGAYEVLGDDITRWAKGALSGDVAAMYEQFAA
ncbi:NAD(P)-dependent dehydrogenase (short-subunit alcohol dehydrogenase family) [Streptomyces griseochromogenes]|uniref:NAD(P)-dependent dehydrogenase (Short-subunit alcohol dehydrogenase family) n=1 Tax=Streptomyces griseochromogenes TaxID=68214 RepID=A0A1B1AXK8_9ACTN|nr:SDR family oxidoreductase [Streptomyces griseochromogenes]ANP51316.1 short-chain dehydrogenase [Streptomyces griseochromogenes]MBP2049984.1 NAD(P)-dependent dehydrogenase (short-subunit alcohol dehydrogenase family) [Streptomyces griseochromogenes]